MTPPAAEPLEAVQQYIDRMPSLSTTVTKVLEVCNRPNTSPIDLNRVISLDPVLTAQVLKLINSAYYSLPNQITSLVRAIIMLGINTVKNLALSTAVVGAIRQSGAGMPVDTFWTHCLCTGVTARLLAAACGVPANHHEEFFVAGLLHDIGKIPLHACFPDLYQQARAVAELEEGPVLRAEMLVLGCTHEDAGRLIADRWKLGPAMAAAVVHHHAPEEAEEGQRQLARIVSLANLFANVYDYGSAGDRHPDPGEIDTLLAATGLSWPQLQRLTGSVMGEIDKAKVFLQV